MTTEYTTYACSTCKKQMSLAELMNHVCGMTEERVREIARAVFDEAYMVALKSQPAAQASASPYTRGSVGECHEEITSLKKERDTLKAKLAATKEVMDTRGIELLRSAERMEELKAKLASAEKALDEIAASIVGGYQQPIFYFQAVWCTTHSSAPAASEVPSDLEARKSEEGVRPSPRQKG